LQIILGKHAPELYIDFDMPPKASQTERMDFLASIVVLRQWRRLWSCFQDNGDALYQAFKDCGMERGPSPGIYKHIGII
jgi:hypothetical protein